MNIYLVRHAEAVEQADGLEDAVRWLTPKGRKTMHKVATRLRKQKVRPDLIITSPLTRAVQTSELLMTELGKKSELIADNLLAPEAGPQQVVDLIQSRTGKDSIMLVGHEPLLSRTAALLLGRESLPGLAKASCICLEYRDKPGKTAKFIWYALPLRKLICSERKVLGPAKQT